MSKPLVLNNGVPKAGVDVLPLAGGTMSGAIAMGANKITGMAEPIALTDAATKNYSDSCRGITILSPSNNAVTSIPTFGPVAIDMSGLTGWHIYKLPDPTGQPIGARMLVVLSAGAGGNVTFWTNNGAALPIFAANGIGNQGRYYAGQSVEFCVYNPSYPAGDGSWVVASSSIPPVIALAPITPVVNATTYQALWGINFFDLTALTSGQSITVKLPDISMSGQPGKECTIRGIGTNNGGTFTVVTYTSGVLTNSIVGISGTTITAKSSDLSYTWSFAVSQPPPTSSPTAYSGVMRDANGDFSAGTITANLTGNASGTAANVTGTVAIANGGTGQTTKAPAFDALSPMTAVGDLILGGAAGTGTALTIGANTYVLTSNGTTASWAAPSGGMTNPMSASGDIIYGGTAGAPTRLIKGSDTQVLTLASGLPTWATPSAGGGGATFTGTAGETLALGDAVYKSVGAADGSRTAGRLYKLDATNSYRIEYVGVVSVGGAGGASVTVQTGGQLTGLTFATAGPIYASVTVPGSFQMTVPTVLGQYVIQLGVAETAGNLVINGAGSATAVQVTAGGQAVAVVGSATGQTGTTVTFGANYVFGAAAPFYRNGILMRKVSSFTSGTDNYADEYQEVDSGSASTQITLNSSFPATASENFAFTGSGTASSTVTFMPVVAGSYGTPISISAATAISASSTAALSVTFVTGNGGPITVTANPPIAAGANIGQQLTIMGTSDTNTVTYTSGNTLMINGSMTLDQYATLTAMWDGLNWVEMARNR
jgi:hypothetical protein